MNKVYLQLLILAGRCRLAEEPDIPAYGQTHMRVFSKAGGRSAHIVITRSFRARVAAAEIVAQPSFVLADLM
jgi:hypothetical protein